MAITISDLLEMSHLRLHLVSGADGLDRAVSWTLYRRNRALAPDRARQTAPSASRPTRAGPTDTTGTALRQLAPRRTRPHGPTTPTPDRRTRPALARPGNSPLRSRHPRARPLRGRRATVL